MRREVRILGGTAQPGRVRHLLAQGVLGFLRQPAIMGVSKMPGAMVATRISERASSRAIGSVIACTAPLEAA